MQKIILIFFISLSTLAKAQDEEMKATFVTTPISIDGKNTEWGNLAMYDRNTKLYYGISNDSANIYFCFETSEKESQLRIMHAGMKVTLSSKGKNKHTSTISFPMIAPQTNDWKMQRTMGKAGTVAMHQTFIMNNTMMDAEGFAGRNGVIPIKSAGGINAAINWDSASTLIYEIAIPFKEYFGNTYSAEDLLKEFSLTTEVNALKYKQEDTETTGFNGSPGIGGREGLDPVALFVPTSFKQKFTLGKSN